MRDPVLQHHELTLQPEQLFEIDAALERLLLGMLRSSARTLPRIRGLSLSLQCVTTSENATYLIRPDGYVAPRTQMRVRMRCVPMHAGTNCAAVSRNV